MSKFSLLAPSYSVIYDVTVAVKSVKTLLAKYYTYCSSTNEEPLFISVYQTIVENKAEIEKKKISVSSNSPERYFNKWKPLLTNNS